MFLFMWVVSIDSILEIKMETFFFIFITWLRWVLVVAHGIFVAVRGLL